MDIFLGLVFKIIYSLIDIYVWIIIISAILSWIYPWLYENSHNQLARLIIQLASVLYRLTEPVYAFIRRLIPTAIGGIDFAPLIVLIALQLLQGALLSIVWAVI